MDEKSILQFCRERNVEICTYYDFKMDCLVIRMKRKQNIIERRINCLEAKSSDFGLNARITIRSMADELDKAEKEENKTMHVL